MRLVQVIRQMPARIQRSMVRSGTAVAKYTGEVTPMPGCPDLAVSHAVYHMEGNSGFGKRANRQRCLQLARLGYSAVICTVEAGNGKQLTILREEGWHESPPFRNRRTGHDVIVFMKGLTE